MATSKSNKKPEQKDKDKTAFSVWMDKSSIRRWDNYCAIAGITRAQLTESAIAEYLRKHPLTAAQKQAYMEQMGLL